MKPIYQQDLEGLRNAMKDNYSHIHINIKRVWKWIFWLVVATLIPWVILGAILIWACLRPL